MKEKLKKIAERKKELEAELLLPQTLNDKEKFTLLSREFNELDNILKIAEGIEILENQIAKNKTLLFELREKELLDLVNDEIRQAEEKKSKLLEKLQDYFTPRDPRDSKNVILEIRQAAGGEEAGLFAAELFRMYVRYAERKGWKTSLISQAPTGIGGLKEVIFEISGKGIWSDLKNEAGVHRVQRVPKTEAIGRVHTSTVTVAVLPEADEVDIKIRPEDLRIDVFRSSGHGGQSVNTTDSAVRITHLPTGIVVSCQDEKSQLKNKEKGLKVLRSRLLAREQEKKQREVAASKKSQIGTGERAEKIRTYNFPQDRVTDHRTGKNYHNLPAILDGKLDEVIEDLKKLE